MVYIDTDLEKNTEELKGRLREQFKDEPATWCRLVADLLEDDLGNVPAAAAYRAMALWDKKGHLVADGLYQRLELEVGEMPDPPAGLAKLVAEEPGVVDRTLLVLVPGGVPLAEMARKANDWCKANGKQPAVWDRTVTWLERYDQNIGAPEASHWAVFEMAADPAFKGKSDTNQ